MNDGLIDRFKNILYSGDSLLTNVYSGIKMLIENNIAYYGVLWLGDNQDSLKPYYWLCPYDLSKCSCNEYVDKSYLNKKVILSEDSVFCGEKISSIICLPICINGNVLGVFEFVRKNDKFNDKDINFLKKIISIICDAFNMNNFIIDNCKDKELLLSISNLFKTYDNGIIKNKVLKGINVDIYKGEFLCILGESGCGKSTLLNIIGGLIDADQGSIMFNGKQIIGLSEKELTKHRRDNIGYIFQNYNLMPNLTAKQNLDLIAELISKSESSVNMLKLVGMGDKLNSYPSELSGGQQQRVSIARALVKNPILILADEPTAALDCETSKGVLEVFEKVVKNGQTLIVVTHNENITKIANRVIRLKNGKIYETIINMNPMNAKDLEW